VPKSDLRRDPTLDERKNCLATSPFEVQCRLVENFQFVVVIGVDFDVGNSGLIVKGSKSSGGLVGNEGILVETDEKDRFVDLFEDSSNVLVRTSGGSAYASANLMSPVKHQSLSLGCATEVDEFSGHVSKDVRKKDDEPRDPPDPGIRVCFVVEGSRSDDEYASDLVEDGGVLELEFACVQ